jgi:hypothetical protein
MKTKCYVALALTSALTFTQVQRAESQTVTVGVTCLVVGGAFVGYSWYWCKNHGLGTNIIDPASRYQINYWTGIDPNNGQLFGFQGEQWGALNPFTFMSTLPLVKQQSMPLIGGGFAVQYWVDCYGQPNIVTGTNAVPLAAPAMEQTVGSNGVSITVGPMRLTWIPGTGTSCYGVGYASTGVTNFSNADGDTVNIAPATPPTISVQCSTDMHNWTNLVSNYASAGKVFTFANTNAVEPAMFYRARVQ